MKCVITACPHVASDKEGLLCPRCDATVTKTLLHAEVYRRRQLRKGVL
jgi:hypothetical protein